MRFLAAMWAVFAVMVWWWPMSKFTQSVDLLFLSATILALRSAWGRLDRANKAVTEAREILRQVRDARPEDLS